MRNLGVWAVLLACVAPLAQAEDVYCRRPTWAASMTAMRRGLAQVALKDIKFAEWRVSDPLPAQSLSDQPIPQDTVAPDTRDKDGRRVLRSQGHWPDGHVHGLGNRPKTLRYLYREIRFVRPAPRRSSSAPRARSSSG